MPGKETFLDDIFQYRRAIILLSAAETGLLEYCYRNKTVSINSVIKQFSWDERGAEIYLNALCGLGYLEKNNQEYSITGHLSSQIEQSNISLFQEWMRHEWRLLTRWIHLPEVLNSGKPYREPEKTKIHRNHRNFILSMAHREQLNAQSLQNAIDLSGFRHLLDLGGGPGLFSIAFAKKNPGLVSTVFDTPETESIAGEFINQSGLQHRLKFIAGDFLLDDIGGGYDAALLSSILHIYGPEENIRLLQKVSRAMVTGGKIIIRDFVLNPDKTGPVIGSLFAVNMLINTDQGNAYTYREMKSWLNQAGFKRVRRKKLEGRMLLIEAFKK
jgi:predicted O-methyltransferase YrrM